MSSTLIASVLILSLSAVHWRLRRHAGWMASPRGRFFVMLSYPLAALAAYWMCSAATSLEWALAGGWAMAWISSTLVGLGALKRVSAEHAARAVALETITPAVSR
ncbi:hypothetical protein [Mycolicibacterium parafortuitum]|uniref:Uncharacterized protein n=1 Tax=Mycolicibacterium parafortuitum TaxID=39692 RepID=A0A375YHU3_MYCPF|nr:hypothetical protein [Mycolicibacterium parafortuitum]ORB30613.1 hypothetical protein BST38_10005 [Mycolicibacterium parafortuitum]SRX80653.1 hypothetical protein MPP7335_02397 [Mycolicibacterium parafortuitum]